MRMGEEETGHDSFLDLNDINQWICWARKEVGLETIGHRACRVEWRDHWSRTCVAQRSRRRGSRRSKRIRLMRFIFVKDIDIYVYTVLCVYIMTDKNIFQLVLFITELIPDESMRPNKLEYLGNMGSSLIGLSCRPNPAPSRPSPAGCWLQHFSASGGSS